MAAYFFVRVSYVGNIYPSGALSSRCFLVRKVAPELSGDPGRAEWRHLEPVEVVPVHRIKGIPAGKPVKGIGLRHFYRRKVGAMFGGTIARVDQKDGQGRYTAPGKEGGSRKKEGAEHKGQGVE